MLLWVLLAVLTAGALGAVLRPMFMSYVNTPGREAFDVAVYRDQLKEIDSDIERGLITEVEGRTARTEVSRRLLASAENSGVQNSDYASADSVQVSPVALAVCILMAPVLSLAMYLAVGSPHLPAQPLKARIAASGDVDHVRGLVAKVEASLAKRPDDGKGWEVLAPVYFKLGRFADSAKAYKEAGRLLGESAERLSGFAEATVRASDNTVTEEAKVAFRRALELEPELMLPRVRLIFALEQEGKKDEAVRAWTLLQKQAGDNEPLKQMAGIRIAALTGKKAPEAEQKPAGEGEAQLKNPSAEDMKAAGQMSSGDRGAMIQNMVAGLAQRLAESGGTPQEWIRLIRSYSVLGNRDLAAKALKDARENLKNNAGGLDEVNRFAAELGLPS